MNLLDKTIRAAADLIERHGWIQGDYSDHTGFCAIGALVECCEQQGIYLAIASQRLRDHIGCYFITEWNDHPRRTKGEVVATLRGASGMGYWGAGIVGGQP